MHSFFSTQRKYFYFFLLLGGVTAFFLLFGAYNTTLDELNANLTNSRTLSSQNTPLARFVTFLKQGELEKLSATEFFRYQGFYEFFQDVQHCSIITEVTTHSTSTGFWLHFFCTSSGNSLHPYFGFFQTEGVKEVLWGRTPRGKVLSQKGQENKKILAIENISSVPIDTNSIWTNSEGNVIDVSAQSNKGEVLKGEVALFVTDRTDEILLFESEYGFYLDLQ